MRKAFLFLTIPMLVISGCSKEQGPVVSVDPVVKNIIGKWALDDVFHTEKILMAGSLHTNPYGDTLIYTQDAHFYIVNYHQDIVDRGGFEVGHGEAINGFGRMQQYDSILYHSASLLTDATYRPMVYFKLNEDTLLMSTDFFKDSAKNREYARYIRQ